MPTNIYLDLTREFNAGRLRCIVSSGQAVVLHQLALMSKDGDWILREDEEAVRHVLGVLEKRGAHYRFGAPLDIRWLAGGWSAHLEFLHGAEGAVPLRVRNDFVTRPPRLSPVDVARLWAEPTESATAPGVPVIDVRRLAELKKTNRERDYAVIGELARRLESPRDQLLLSQSVLDLLALAQAHPNLVSQLQEQRPVLSRVQEGRDALEIALDAERRTLMRVHEERLSMYSVAARQWAGVWRLLENEMSGLPLRTAHDLLRRTALELLPAQP